MLVLATVALAVFGVASVLLIRKSQVDRIDARLTDLSRRGGNFVARQPNPNGRDNLPTEFRVYLFNADGVLNRTLGQPEGDTGGPRLPAMDSGTVAAHNGAPFTVDDRAGGPSWRVRIIPVGDAYTATALSLAEVEATVRQLVTIEAIVGSMLLITLGAVGFAVVRMNLRPLTRIEQTAAAIARGELDARVPDTDSRTETGRLGRALNTMLARLSSAIRQRERSEARLRRFVADASHELRTPLTSIRGFAELYRHGGATQPSDV